MAVVESVYSELARIFRLPNRDTLSDPNIEKLMFMKGNQHVVAMEAEQD